MYFGEEKANYYHLRHFSFIYIYCLHLQATILLERSFLFGCQCSFVLRYSKRLTSSVSLALMWNIRGISGGWALQRWVIRGTGPGLLLALVLLRVLLCDLAPDTSLHGF